MDESSFPPCRFRFFLTTPRLAAINAQSRDGRTIKHHPIKHSILFALGVGLALALPLQAGNNPNKPKETPATVFKKKDTNGDGFLSKEEFAGKNKAAKADARFPKFDPDGDGKLSLEEYQKGLKQKK